MAKLLTVLVIIVKVLLSNGQEDHFIDESTGYQHPNEEHPNYSYGYGVSDSHTGDIKTVWEAKKGDTVKGHYSVIEPDGSMRSVEYSAGPNTGFTATVNRDGLEARPTDEEDIMEEKALRDYHRNYDFSEDADEENSFKSINRKRQKHPYESYESFKDYSLSKRPKHPIDMETSEYTHSFNIKHPRDDLNAEASGHSHVGVSFDPNCNTKSKKQKHKHYSGADLDFRKQKYPSLISDPYNNDYDKYVGDASNIEIEKLIHMYKQNDRYKPYKPDDSNGWPSTKNSYPAMSDIPHSEDSYSDYLPPRPKKKYKPYKNQEPYESEDLDDYVLVPKKKLKKPPRVIEPYPDSDEEFAETYEDERYHKPPRGTRTEVIRKVVKKKKPVINILDIFDI